MAETGTIDCPLPSFLKYKSKLHPNSDRFWCYPKDSFTPDEQTWYTAKPVGHNALTTFLSKLSQKCQLSRIYSNHSIRNTAATLLHNNSFAPASIQSITGHKSLQSLAVYQETSSSKKLQMADTLHEHIAGKSLSLAIPSTSHTGTVNEIETITDSELNIIFSDENKPDDTSNPVFKGCTFQIFTLNITISKQWHWLWTYNRITTPVKMTEGFELTFCSSKHGQTVQITLFHIYFLLL